MRIQKYLANHSQLSRRQVERLILEGHVTVNDQLAEIGQSVGRGDCIIVDGQSFNVQFSTSERPQVLILNKPLGVICSKVDAQMRPTIFELLPNQNQEKWIMVGRLDVNTSGLILFTTNGDFAHKLMHPSSQLVRRYHVRVYGEVRSEAVTCMLQGVMIDGRRLSFKSCKQLKNKQHAKNAWYEVEVLSGQYRMVRRLWESQSIRVSRLVRVAYGPVSLPKSLRVGTCAMLSDVDVDALSKEVISAPKT
tara:strand:- start:1207 stop:1953 length:747 start_codon:yes stop_codon:yes gene_type:complete